MAESTTPRANNDPKVTATGSAAEGTHRSPAGQQKATNAAASRVRKDDRKDDGVSRNEGHAASGIADEQLAVDPVVDLDPKPFGEPEADRTNPTAGDVKASLEKASKQRHPRGGGPASESGDPDIQRLLAQLNAARLNQDEKLADRCIAKIGELGYTAE